MNQNTKNKAQWDWDNGIAQSVKSSEKVRFPDWAEPIKGHAEDDVDGAGHEDVDEGELEMRLVEGNEIMPSR